jgi:hypothetical protein
MPIQENAINLLHHPLNREMANASIFGTGTLALVGIGLETIVRGVEQNDPGLIGLGFFAILLATQTGQDFVQHMKALNKPPKT